MRFPFFEEDIFCNILIDNVALCQRIKPFELIGFKINPDHSHFIIQPTGTFNISKIMQNIKRTTSNQINQLISFKQQENYYENLELTERLMLYNRMFIRKYNYSEFHDFPRFKWQVSFDDRIMRSEKQLQGTTQYLKKQAVKHELKEDKFLYVAEEKPRNVVFMK